MKSITVYCASSEGNHSNYKQIAFAVGRKLAKNGICVIYGGAQVGLMGAVADGALSVGGKVIGVIPDFLKTKEIAHTGLSELIVVESMHERKMKMHELCEGIIALPGGFGTLEELFEMLTWAQLGLHQKPIGVLNVKEYYTPLRTMIEQMNLAGLLREQHKNMLLMADSFDELWGLMDRYQPPQLPKWMQKGEQ